MASIGSVEQSYLTFTTPTVLSVRAPNGKIVPVDSERFHNDKRDFVLIDTTQYTAFEEVDYKDNGFIKLGDTWMFPEEEPVPKENQKQSSLEG